MFLDAEGARLDADRPGTSQTVDYDPAGPGATFLHPAFEAETEITGPIALKLFISSETEDADIFAVVRVFDETDQEITLVRSTRIRRWLRVGYALRTAGSTPTSANPIGRTTHRTAKNHSTQAKYMSSMSRFGRLRS